MPASRASIDIDLPNLAEVLRGLTEDEINSLPFGVIRLDEDGVVVFFSDRERQMSGLRKEAVNRLFFVDIAPCLNTSRYRGRIEKALASGQLDMTFEETTDLPNGEQDVDLHVRVLATKGGGCWILTKYDL
jgi:photoactive yellow protein